MSGEAPRFRIGQIELFEAPVRLRMPFRFGVVTLTHCQQVWVRVHIEGAGGLQGTGAAAELLSPKWFDKNPALSNEQNLDQLRDVLHLAAQAYTADQAMDRGDTAFGHFARHHDAHQRTAAARGHNPLLASYGPALIDRAVLDALCRATGLSFYTVMRRNLAGIGGTHPAFGAFDLNTFLAGLTPAPTLAARHTVGLADPISAKDVTEPLHDGLPQTLEQVIARYGHRHFKLKLSGQVDADLQRLHAIGRVLDRSEEHYQVTLDGNEQFADAATLTALAQGLRAAPALKQLADSVLFVEQPFHRAIALQPDRPAPDVGWPLLIDESDGTLEAFEQARALGWRGVSSKTCKGLYKSVLNGARCEAWNTQCHKPGQFFLSGEDLTLQPGLGLQQDLALVSLLGITHVERNGHHYVDGMRGRPAAEQQAFAQAHPDLYEQVVAPDGQTLTRVCIQGGRMAIASLACPGFASTVLPDFSAMQTLAPPADLPDTPPLPWPP
jgi:L-alanine-DL-glutamate epimerase-like enolase superfamily enzyme